VLINTRTINLLRRTTTPVVLSAPHYVHELRQIRTLSAFGHWLQFKFPFAFSFSPTPLYVTIELTTLCNLSCTHCWRLSSIKERGIGSMSIGTFGKIVKELSVMKRPPDVLKIGGSGEPSLHPQFQEAMSLLDMLRDRAIHVIVYSNGTFLERFSPRVIAGWNVHRLVISVDGIDRASYEQVRVGGDYRRLRKLVCEFRDFRDGSLHGRPWIEVRHVVMDDETAVQLLHFRRHWLPPGDTVKFQSLDATSMEARALFGLTSRGPFRELPIQWNGNVPIYNGCNGFAGNLETQSVEQAWRRIKGSLRTHAAAAR
jgi:hypothetical protein